MVGLFEAKQIDKAGRGVVSVFELPIKSTLSLKIKNKKKPTLSCAVFISADELPHRLDYCSNHTHESQNLIFFNQILNSFSLVSIHLNSPNSVQIKIFE